MATRIIYETAHALLLDVDGRQAWVSRDQFKNKGSGLGELSAEIADRLVGQPAVWVSKGRRVAGQPGAQVSKGRRVVDLAILADELGFTGGLKIVPKPNQGHQAAALAKLCDNSRFALFMQMRAGKTKVAIDLICNHFAHGRIGRVLWLCPNSATATAEQQWAKFAVLPVPRKIVALETVSGCGQGRMAEIAAWATPDCAIIIDESQMVKNARAKRSRRLDGLLKTAPVVGILSGTPITQNIQDLYNQAKSLDWRIFGYRNPYQFNAAHLIMSDKFPGLIRDTKDTAFLSQRLQPFVYEWFPRYGKREYHTVYITPSDEQMMAMAEIKEAVLNRLRQYTEHRSDIYLLFTALQSVLSGRVSARTLTQVFGRRHNRDWLLPTPKLDVLVRQLDLTGGQRIVWCTRRHELHSIADRIPGSIIISGEMPAAERHRRVQEFRGSMDGILIAMVQVAKRAIEMSECNQVFYYGHSFDYESREQSEWRVLLPNKAETCHYTNLLYENTLDERIQHAHSKKRNVISEFLEMLKHDRERALNDMEQM